MDLDSLALQLFEQYRAFNEAHPVIGSMATGSVIFPTADIASQLITDKKVNWKKVRYTAALAPLYGAYGYLSVRSGDLVGEYISEHPLAKAALGPNIIGLPFNLLFFTNNSVGEHSGYRLKNLARHYGSFCKDLLFDKTKNMYQKMKEGIFSHVPWKEYVYSAIGTVTFWNAFQYTNYQYISKEMQTPATLSVALGWTVVLSIWSLMGRKEIVKS